MPAQPDILPPEKRSPRGDYGAGGAQAAPVKTAEKQLPSDLRLCPSRPHPSPRSPSLLALPPSRAGSLARSPAPVLQLRQVPPPSERGKAAETDLALLLISQGERLQACERPMHTLLTNAGDDPARPKSDLCRGESAREGTLPPGPAHNKSCEGAPGERVGLLKEPGRFGGSRWTPLEQTIGKPFLKPPMMGVKIEARE